MKLDEPGPAAIAGLAGAIVWVGASAVISGSPNVSGALVFGGAFAASSYLMSKRRESDV